MGERRFRRAVAAVAAMVMLAGCGGGSTEKDPLAGGPPEEDIRLQPGDRPLRFQLDATLPDEDKAFIVETLQWAHNDLGDSGPVTVRVYRNADNIVEAVRANGGPDRAEMRAELEGGTFAFTIARSTIWIYLPNFEADPVAEKRVTFFHEYFHTVQAWLSELQFQSESPAEQSFVPRWLIEGCAQYLAVSAAATRGMLDEAKARRVVVKGAQNGGETLASLGTEGGAPSGGGSGAAYDVGYLGCERLAATRGRDSVLRTFWASLAKVRDWQGAFRQAFGQDPQAFYADFEAWRATQ